MAPHCISIPADLVALAASTSTLPRAPSSAKMTTTKPVKVGRLMNSSQTDNALTYIEDELFVAVQ
jgi:hypothetical protein